MNNKFIYIFTTLFLLSSCGGGGGGSSVIPFPSININSNLIDINSGGTVEISWSSSNATSCSASWTSSSLTSGSASVVLNTPGDNNISISCQGEGGTSSTSVKVFVFDVGVGLKNMVVDEDNSISDSIIANPNSEVTVSYQIITQPQNGTLQYSAVTKDVIYTPSQDFNGTDSFTY